MQNRSSKWVNAPVFVPKGKNPIVENPDTTANNRHAELLQIKAANEAMYNLEVHFPQLEKSTATNASSNARIVSSSSSTTTGASQPANISRPVSFSHVLKAPKPGLFPRSVLTDKPESASELLVEKSKIQAKTANEKNTRKKTDRSRMMLDNIILIKQKEKKLKLTWSQSNKLNKIVKKQRNKAGRKRANPLDASAPILLNSKSRNKVPTTLRKRIIKDKELLKQAKEILAKYEKSEAESYDDVAEQMAKISLDEKRQAEKVIEQRTERAPFSNNYRSYCRNAKSAELNIACKELLTILKTYQDRVYAKETDQRKAHLKRRVTVGLREVKRDVDLDKVKMVIIATDIKANPIAGGLDDQISQICKLCNDKNIPIVFALKQAQLGRILKKPKASIVAINNYQSAETFVKNLTDLLQKACSDFVSEINETEQTK